MVTGATGQRGNGGGGSTQAAPWSPKFSSIVLKILMEPCIASIKAHIDVLLASAAEQGLLTACQLQHCAQRLHACSPCDKAHKKAATRVRSAVVGRSERVLELLKGKWRLLTERT